MPTTAVIGANKTIRSLEPVIFCVCRVWMNYPSFGMSCRETFLSLDQDRSFRLGSDTPRQRPAPRIGCSRDEDETFLRPVLHKESFSSFGFENRVADY